MEIYLRSGVYGVPVGADLALIDLDADAYLCLPGGAQAFGGDAEQSLRPDTSGLDAMVAAGLTSDTPSPRRGTPPPLPGRTILHDRLERVSSRQMMRAIRAAIEIRGLLHAAGLHSMLSAASDRLPSADADAVVPAARAFWKIMPWLPVEGECLVRSALLMSFLKHSGLSADWVFGVRLWPFSAHCWVQVGDVCLNDDVERLAAYTPIYCR